MQKCLLTFCQLVEHFLITVLPGLDIQKTLIFYFHRLVGHTIEGVVMMHI